MQTTDRTDRSWTSSPSAGPGGPAPADLEPGRQVPIGAFLAAIACSTVVLGFLARNVFLFWDDYLFLGQAQRGSWSQDHLTDGLFQHFSPVTRAVNLVVVGVLPGRPWVIWVVLMVLAAVLVASTTLLMVALFGRTWVALVGSVLLGPTLSLLPLVNWWTAGVNIMPALAGSALCLTGVVQLVRGRSRWWGVLAVAAYLVAVLDYESAIMVAGYAAAWTLLFRRRVTQDSLWTVLRRTWWTWALLVVIGGASVWNYRVNYYVKAPPAQIGDVARGMWISLVDTLAPSLLGFHDPSTHWVALTGTVAGVVALAGLVLFTLIRRVGAWRGWLFALGGWFLPCAALVVNRVGYFGPAVAQNIVYFYLPSLLFVVGALEAWVAPARARAPRTTSRPWVTPARRVAGVLVVALVVFGYVNSADPTVSARIPFGADPDYVQTAAASAAAIPGGPGSYSVISGTVTEGLVPAAFAPYNRTGTVLGVNIAGLTFDAATGPYYTADLVGVLQPVAVHVEPDQTYVAGSPALAVTGADDVHDVPGKGTCFRTVDGASRVTLTLTRPVAGDRLVVQSLVTVDRPTSERLRVTDTPGGGWTNANDDSNRWVPGEPGRLDTVASPKVSQLVYDQFTPGTQVCLSSVAVGSVGPRP